MNENIQTNAQGENGWQALKETIKALAVRKTGAMLHASDADDEVFDRSARTLRTLMSAAEIARRMIAQEAKDQEFNDQAKEPPAITDDDIQKIYHDVQRKIEKIANEAGHGENKT